MDKVYLVQKICDIEYFHRETVYVSTTRERAEEWISKQDDKGKVIGYKGVEGEMYIIEYWEIDS